MALWAAPTAVLLHQLHNRAGRRATAFTILSVEQRGPFFLCL